MVTLLTLDPILDTCRQAGPLAINAVRHGGNVPVMAIDGSSFSVGTNVPCDRDPASTGTWLMGDQTQGQSPIKKGDLILFTNPQGQAMQTVTRTDATNVYFDSNVRRQPSASTSGTSRRDRSRSFSRSPAGPGNNPPAAYLGMTAQRVFMYTYYVDSSQMGEPHLIRQLNNFTPQALAGVVEDLELSYDLVDGTVNPVHVKNLPYTHNGVTYAANQIRKVNVHIGVRSEAMSTRLHDYLRNHLTTVVSLRSLAFVDRYQ